MIQSDTKGLFVENDMMNEGTGKSFTKNLAFLLGAQAKGGTNSPEPVDGGSSGYKGVGAGMPRLTMDALGW